MISELDRIAFLTQGMRTERHAPLLYGLVRSLRPNAVIQVGVWRGFMTCHIALALEHNQNGLVYAIDPFDPRWGAELGAQPDAGACQRAVAELGAASRLRLIQGTVDNLQPIPAQVAYIDGDHRRDAVAKDFEYVVRCGCDTIALHDTTGNAGAVYWLAEFRENRDLGEWDIIEFYHDEGLALVRRRSPKPEPTYGTI